MVDPERPTDPAHRDEDRSSAPGGPPASRPSADAARDGLELDRAALEELDPEDARLRALELPLEPYLGGPDGGPDGGWGDTRAGAPGVARPSFRAGLRASFVTGRFEGDGAPPGAVARALDGWAVAPPRPAARARARAAFLAATTAAAGTPAAAPRHDAARSPAPARVDAPATRGRHTRRGPTRGVRRAAGERPQLAPRRGPLLLAGAVAALAAVFLAVALLGGGGRLRYELAGPRAGDVASADAPLAGVLLDGAPPASARALLDGLARGARVTTGDGGLRLVAGEVLVLELGPATEVILPALASAEDLRIDARRGAVRVATGPRFARAAGATPRRLSVLTPHAEAVVVGTIFGVDVGADYTCVCCLEGRVEMLPSAATLTADEVAAGRTRIVTAAPDSQSLDLVTHHRAALEALAGFW